MVVRWSCDEAEGELVLAANLSARATAGFPAAQGRVFWSEGAIGEGGLFGPWAVRWSLKRLPTGPANRTPVAGAHPHG